MTLKVPNEGELELLKYMLKENPSNLLLHLYENDYTPGLTSVIGDFTESTWTGYSAITLTASNWTDPITTMDGKAETRYGTSVLSWTRSGLGSDDLYGYYVTDTDETIVLWAERFDPTRTLGNGDVVNFQPVFTLYNE